MLVTCLFCSLIRAEMLLSNQTIRSGRHWKEGKTKQQTALPGSGEVAAVIREGSLPRDPGTRMSLSFCKSYPVSSKNAHGWDPSDCSYWNLFLFTPSAPWQSSSVPLVHSVSLWSRRLVHTCSPQPPAHSPPSVPSADGLASSFTEKT